MDSPVQKNWSEVVYEGIKCLSKAISMQGEPVEYGLQWNQHIPQKKCSNAESQSPPQTYRIQIFILIRSQHSLYF